MGKSYIESSLKRFLKRKVKITLGFVVAFMIMGTGVFAEDIKVETIGNKNYYVSLPDENTGIGVGSTVSYGTSKILANGNVTYTYDGSKLKVEYNFVKDNERPAYSLEKSDEIEREHTGNLIIGGQIYINSYYDFKKDDETKDRKLVLNAEGQNIEVNAKNDKGYNTSKPLAAIGIQRHGYAEIYAENLTLNNNFSSGITQGIILEAGNEDNLESGLKINLTGDFNIKNFNEGIKINQSCNIEEIKAVNMQIFNENSSGNTGIWLGQTSTDGEGKSNSSGINLDIVEEFKIENYNEGIRISNYNAKLDLSSKNIKLKNGDKGIYVEIGTLQNKIPEGEKLSENIITAANNIDIIDYNTGIENRDGKLKLSAENINIISTIKKETGIKNAKSVHGEESYSELSANNIVIKNYEDGIVNGKISIRGKNGVKKLSLKANNSIEISDVDNGIYSENKNSIVSLESNYNKIISNKTALEVKSSGEISIIGKSEIKGDIKASSSGLVKIIGENNFINSSEIKASSNGKIELNLTNGKLIGKADDDRANSLSLNTGIINLNIDNGTWESQGRGFVTEVNLTNGGTIKFTDKASSVDIKNLKGNGNGTFEMIVNPDDKSDGNMIYVQNSTGGIYQINLQNSDLSKIKVGDKIRFATIGKDAKENNLEFTVLDVKERGIKDVSFKVDSEDFEKGDTDNTVYNNGDNKSGNEYVENNYENGENWHLTREEDKPSPNPDENINDIGKTVIEMARANYASAVYMDNLNKRLGDMSFAEGNSGLWVRMRNDRVGEDKEYRLHNYMTQIGYDKTYTLDEGKEYRGAALEYTRGDMKYKNLNGKTEMDRYMFTAYDTRVYNNGLYADYTGRAGYMSSDFEVTGRETGNKAKGDYHNLVLGAGAEFGKRYDFGETSYFEPQVQLQYTYIDDADYTTSQDTKVKYEEIHSLIGRAGVRLGHDFYKENSKDNTIYLKADINHEFLGEQDIKAQDVTGTINKTYENDNTWYDIGIGGAKNLTENLYVYADIERQFGEERDNSWQFNLGFRYKFGSFKDFTFNTANLFDFDKSEVKPEGKEMIKNASEIMNAKKLKGTLLIEGHTDWTGDEEYNQILSEKRAKAVEEVFKENVTNENIKYEIKGYGETKPVADNKTKEGRAANRRVEVNYIK